MRRAARRGAGDGAEEPDEAVQRGFSLAGGRQKRKLAVVKQEQECEEGDSEELELRWEWEGDDGTWNVYSDKLNEELTQEFRAGKVSCTIALNSSTKLLVDVKKMLQRNLQTSFERRVRLAVRDQDHYYVWQWDGDDSNWLPYSANTCVALEMAQRKDEKVVAASFGRTQYSLDLGKMVQINKKTKFQRKIERKESDAVVANGSSTSSTQASGDAPTPAKRVCGSKVQKCSQSPAPGTSVQQESIETVKTLVMKGKAPVDPECKAKLGKTHGLTSHTGNHRMDDAEDSPHDPAAPPKRAVLCWTEVETLDLLGVLRDSEYVGLLMTPSNKPLQHFWQGVSAILHSCGHTWTWKQCRSKWKGLKFNFFKSLLAHGNEGSAPGSPVQILMRQIWEQAGKPESPSKPGPANFQKRRVPNTATERPEPSLQTSLEETEREHAAASKGAIPSSPSTDYSGYTEAGPSPPSTEAGPSTPVEQGQPSQLVKQEVSSSFSDYEYEELMREIRSLNTNMERLNSSQSRIIAAVESLQVTVNDLKRAIETQTEQSAQVRQRGHSSTDGILYHLLSLLLHQHYPDAPLPPVPPHLRIPAQTSPLSTLSTADFPPPSALEPTTSYPSTSSSELPYPTPPCKTSPS
ncbi:poly [ADP-ribose] polymerase 2 isoform X4 [Latimeria chalumnae]|uniref:poly [ADP-ribose] polymerase 2 isoform X4 n=1 Tax=Latimeria chalumnae TaxID=7897 RepID=UPI00313D6FB1